MYTTMKRAKCVVVIILRLTHVISERRAAVSFPGSCVVPRQLYRSQAAVSRTTVTGTRGHGEPSGSNRVWQIKCSDVITSDERYLKQDT
jgi:hypothetical protein